MVVIENHYREDDRGGHHKHDAVEVRSCNSAAIPPLSYQTNMHSFCNYEKFNELNTYIEVYSYRYLQAMNYVCTLLRQTSKVNCHKYLGLQPIAASSVYLVLSLQG